jgi:hypothetical protein
VWREERLNGVRPPWPVLLERWHQQHANKHFKSPDNFHECYRRAAKAVVAPRFRLPRPMSYEEKLAEVKASTECMETRLAALAEKTNNAPLSED